MNRLFFLLAISFGLIANAAENVPFPPIGDLTPQIDSYIKKLSENMKDLDGSKDYVSDAESLVKDASALTLVALAIGLHPEDSQYKNAAPSIIEACKALKAAKTYKEGQAAVDLLAKSAAVSGDAKTLAWVKLVSMKPAMKAVPSINSGMNRNLRSESTLKKGVARVREGTAALVVILQGSIPNADETIHPNEVGKWKKQCELFRDVALETNKIVHDFEAGKAAFADVKSQFEKMNAACDLCHEHFVEGGKVAATE